MILLIPAFAFELETHVWIAAIGLAMFYLGSGMLLVCALKSDFSKVPAANLIAYIGTFSYSIYLWNAPLQEWLGQSALKFAGNNWFLYAGIYLATTFLVGIGMAKLVEYPILRIRNKYFPSIVPPILQSAEK